MVLELLKKGYILDLNKIKYMVLKLFQKVYILFKNISEAGISESINTT